MVALKLGFSNLKDRTPHALNYKVILFKYLAKYDARPIKNKFFFVMGVLTLKNKFYYGRPLKYSVSHLIS